MLRAGHSSGERAWEVSLMRHKIYLTNPPPGVSDVSVSHGFNILSLNRAFKAGDWTYRFGAGPVVTHAEAALLAIKGAATAAYAVARLPGPPNGELRVSNFALHAMLGIGHEF